MTTRKAAPLTLIVGLLLSACAGGGSETPSKKTAPATRLRANASVKFLWPSRKPANSSDRSARYLSPTSDHIRITNAYAAYYGIAPSDASIVVPFGVATAQIPAYVGVNTWSFQEYDDAAEMHLVSGTSSTLTIIDTNPTTIDVVLELNFANMRVAVRSNDLNVLGTYDQPSNGSPGIIALNTFTAGTKFKFYVAAIDASSNLATGLGTPTISLTSTDSRLTIVRAINTNTSGPYVGLAAYQGTLNSTITNTDILPMSVNAAEPISGSSAEGLINIGPPPG